MREFDWIAFQKMFKVPIPVPKHSEYYIRELSKSPKFAHLPQLVSDFKLFQDRYPVTTGLKQVRQEAMTQLIDYLGATEAYRKFMAAPQPPKISTGDARSQYADWQWLVSLDLVAANFYTFWCFGLEHETWEELCDSQGVDPFLAQSKSLRQIVFGNLNPKRNQRFQAEMISKLWEYLDRQGYHTVFKHHDELVIGTGGTVEDMLRSAQEAATLLGNVPVRITLHKKKRLEGRGQFVVTEYDIDTLQEKYTYLFGVPGNRYMIEFKKHILNEPLDERDRMFINDGRLAMWME